MMNLMRELDENLKRDVLHFICTVAIRFTPEESAKFLHEQQELHEEDASDLAYQNYDSDKTVERFILEARRICDEHHIWELGYA
jgi:hypothetical protein